MEKSNINDINEQYFIDLTKKIFHETLNGKLDVWFSYLDTNSVYMDNSNPILFGVGAIKTQFIKLEGIKSGNIINEEYYYNKINKALHSVLGAITLNNSSPNYATKIHFSIIYKQTDKKEIIVEQHNSFEYREKVKSKTLPNTINPASWKFIQDILMRQQENTRIEIKTSTGSAFIDPCTLLYVRSMDKSCEYVCLDKIVSSNESISKAQQSLPIYFHKIHRCFIINTKFITSIRRFEVELLSKIKLPIPEKNYTKIKEELKDKMKCNNCI